MIKISLKQLRQLKACQAGIIWFKKQRARDVKTIVFALLKDNHFNYAKWLLKNLLTKEQNQLWAINSAESVLSIFESKHPNDNRVRNAINAAKDFFNGRIDLQAVKNAADAAADAAYTAAYAADAAAHAADAAAHAAIRATAAYAADAAAYAADAAAYAAIHATAADAANAARRKKQIEICTFALKLLGESF